MRNILKDVTINPKAKLLVKSEGAIKVFFYLVAIGGHCLANFYWTYPRRSLYPYTWMGPCAICNNMHFWRFSTSVILLPQKRWTGVESNNLFTLLPTSLDSGLDLSSPVSSDQDHVSLSIIWNIYTSQTGKISRLQNNAKCAQIGRFNGAVFSCTSCTTLNCRLWKSNSWQIWYLNLLCRGEMARMCLWGSWPLGSGDFNQSTATSTEEVNIQSLKICSLLFILFILTSSSFATPILLEQQQCQKRALSWVGAKKPHINTSPWMPFILAPPHHSSCFQYNSRISFQIVNEWIVHE